MQGRNSTSAAGMVLAVMAASSMVSGLCYGARTWKSNVGRRFLGFAGFFAVATLPLAFADTTVQLCVLLSFVGVAYAPRIISAYLLLDDLAPGDSLAEAYTWPVSANAGGVALGSAIAGPAVQHAGTRWALAATAAFAAAGYVMAVARRPTLARSRPPLPEKVGRP